MVLWVGGVLLCGWGEASPSSQQLFFYLSDHLGSTRVVVDESGSDVTHLSYYPYGARRPCAGDKQLDLHHTYTGQEHDPETNLMYYGARYYAAELGMFVGRDPVRDDLPYAYANHHPLRFVDPNGRSAEEWTRFVGGFLSGLSPFYDTALAPRDDRPFLLGAAAGSGVRMVVGAVGTGGGGVLSGGSPPTAVATVPLTLIAAGITVDAYADLQASLKAALQAGSSSSSPRRRKPTPENGYLGPSEGWPNGRPELDRLHQKTMAPLWGKSKHPILQDAVKDGLLFEAEGKLANGLYIFNIDREGNIYFNNADLDQTRIGRTLAHSSLIEGENSFGAGYFSVERGVIKKVVDWTGHYSHGNPTFGIERFQGYLINLLNDAGVGGVSEIKFIPYSEVVSGR